MAQELKTILQQLKSMDVDTSMEDAFSMVENLTEELIIKEEKLMSLEKQLKESEDEKRKLFVDNDIYDRMGGDICKTQHGYSDELEHLENVVMYSINDKCFNHQQKMRALELWFNHNMKYPYTYKECVETEENILQRLRDDYECEFGDSDSDDEDNDTEDNRKEIYKRVIENGEYFGSYQDELGIDNVVAQLPWNTEAGENIYVIMWSI